VGTKVADAKVLSSLKSQNNIAFSHVEQLDSQEQGIEYSSVCELPFMALGIGIRRVIKAEIPQIASHVDRLMNILIEGSRKSPWQPIGVNAPRGICFLKAPDTRSSAQAAARKLREEHGIAVSAYETDPAGIRVCISHDNTREEVLQLVEALVEDRRLVSAEPNVM
jgi:selenocysteine lyase/cysteine desulfurase